LKSSDFTDKQKRNHARKIEPEPMTGCWLWTGSCKKTSGYGDVRIGYKNVLAHRMSYAIHRGEIPDGQCVLHKCDNRSCVNPGHLFLGTYKDNAEDRERKGRGNQLSGEAHPRAKLTLLDVAEIRASSAPSRALGRKFGVDKAIIQRIRKGEIWRDAA
jgi:hypothetical protein